MKKQIKRLQVLVAVLSIAIAFAFWAFSYQIYQLFTLIK